MRSFLDNDHGYSVQLVDAVLERDIDAVHQLLQRGAKPNVICGADGHTAVGMAAALGDADMLGLLIKSCNERPPVFSALRAETDTVDNTPEGMDELEWDDEFPDDEGSVDLETKTAADEHATLYLYYAKTLEVTGSILSSIKNGFYAMDKRRDDPHVADESMMTPLHYAAAYGHLNCVDILIKSGCKLNVENADGLTPLHLGTKFYDVTLKLLKNGADPLMHTLNSYETALHMAVRQRNLQVVELLLKHAPSIIDAVDQDERTALVCAIRLDATDIAMLLLEHKARINLADKKGRTALYYAATRNKVELARRLLQRRARRLPEHYLLHSAVRLNFKEMAALLIENGECLTRQNMEGLTPIMLAISCCNADMLALLLKFVAAKPTPTLGSNDFFYLGDELFMAVECTQELKEFEALMNVLLTFTTTKINDAQHARGNGFFFTGCEHFCSTPLAHAIEQKKLSFAVYMIKEGGIDANSACSEHSLLHLVRSWCVPGVLEFIRFLVFNGFKINLQAIPLRYLWLAQPVNFKRELLELCKNPLPLKALTRLVVRRSLLCEPLRKSSNLCQLEAYESFLLERIKKLGLPKPLQTYLYHFPDFNLNFRNENEGLNFFKQ